MGLREQHKVTLTFNKNYVKIPGVTSVPLDALSRDWVKKVIFMVEPDVVIFVAGRSDLIWTEKNAREAERFNATAPVNVVTAMEILQPKFIYISNSYVFEGTKGNYHEDDNVLPATQMGKNKLRTENFLKGKTTNWVVIRSAPLLGRGNGRNFSFLDRLRIALERGETCDVTNQEFQSFGTVYGLVELVSRVTESGLKNKILHYGGITRTTYYDMCIKFCERFGFDPRFIRGERYIQKMKGRQPDEFDFSLNCSEAMKIFKLKPQTIDDCLEQLGEKCVNVY